MKRTYHNTMKWLTVFALWTGVSSAYSATFDWSSTGWNDGDLSGSYTDVDGSGINITVAVTGNTNKFNSGYPKLDDSNGNLNNDHLMEYPDYDDNTQSVTTTFKFSVPVKLSSLIWRDVDAMNDGNNLFDDKIVVSAKDVDGNTVYPNNATLGSDIQDDGNGAYEAKNNNANYSPTDAAATFQIDLDSTYVTEFSYTYTSGDGISNNDNPTGQATWFDNFNFEPRDTDGDGVPDFKDIDDDNDGILDTVEKPAVSLSNTNSGTIPDDGYPNDCLDRTFTMSKTGVVSNVTIDVDIDHTWRGDLVVSLISPNNTSVDLTSDNGGGYDNLKVLFDDSASGTITDYNADMNPPPQIVLRPEGTLSAFNGEDSSGTWTLHMCDDASADEGTFNSAQLNITDIQDNDGDGIEDYLDLDSDNDGIPDNVEAQSTGSYTAPSGTDTDGDGLDDAYDPDNGGTAVPLPDTDGNGIRDNLDSDSDGDGITDCEEGLNGNIYNKACPIDSSSTINANGVVDWADNNSGGYGSPNLGIDKPDPDNGGTKLEDEITGNDEAAYREILCGKAQRELTPFNWVVVSVPCDTGSATISDLFGTSLGTYGDNDNWVMYRQNTQYTGSNSNDMEEMAATDTMVPGKGYWLIVDDSKKDANTGKVTMKLDETVSGITGQTAMDPKSNYGGVGTNDDGFDEVMGYNNLPDSQNGIKSKVMIGNPFVRTIHLGRIYYSNDTLGQTYYPMTDATHTGTYVEQYFYAHDDTDLTSTGYIALDPNSTPGFGDAADPMLGFWMLIKDDAVSGTSSTGNAITYPFEK
ncbi:internalin, putative [hydrothermal vent metagenome]|uniref:Internalin, putative n=1 Tax=hydrothermal vent metagenome TaxID=652676 RepID=A0A1W1BXJ0_9ZZZZ